MSGGYIRKECPTWEKIEGTASLVTSKFNNFADGLLSLSRDQSIEAWILDKVISHHVKFNKECFTSYKSSYFRVVYQGSDVPRHIMGIEDIKNRVKSCVEHVLKDVRHIPKVRRNLISLGELHGDGYVYKVDRVKKTLMFKKDKKLMMKGKRNKNNLYKMRASFVEGVADGDTHGDHISPGNQVQGGGFRGRLVSKQEKTQV